MFRARVACQHLPGCGAVALSVHSQQGCLAGPSSSAPCTLPPAGRLAWVHPTGVHGVPLCACTHSGCKGEDRARETESCPVLGTWGGDRQADRQAVTGTRKIRSQGAAGGKPVGRSLWEAALRRGHVDGGSWGRLGRGITHPGGGTPSCLRSGQEARGLEEAGQRLRADLPRPGRNFKGLGFPLSKVDAPGGSEQRDEAMDLGFHKPRTGQGEQVDMLSPGALLGIGVDHVSFRSAIRAC